MTLLRFARRLPSLTRAVLAILGVSPIHSGYAAGFEVLRHFSATTGSRPSSATPVRRYIAETGVTTFSSVYGTLETGGSSGGATGRGVIYQVDSDGSNFRALHTFSGTDGARPIGGVGVGTSTLYGTTYEGGTGDGGTVWLMNLDGSGFNTLKHFTLGAGGDCRPTGLLTTLGIGTSDGKTTSYLMGTAAGWEESEANYGAIFRVGLDGKNYSVLHVFDSVAGGASPRGDLQSPSSSELPDYIGTTYRGGSATNRLEDSVGTVFGLSYDGRDFRVISSAPGGLGGRHPSGSMVAFNGQPLYGVAVKGGAHGKGVVYRIKPNGSDYTVLHSFTGGTDGANPQSGLVYAGDSLFGTTSPLEPGADSATIFRINVNTGSYGVIHRFNPTTDGSSPSGTLTAIGHTLIGVAASGGTTNGGTLYKFALDPVAQAQTVSTTPNTPVAITLIAAPSDGFSTTYATTFGPFNGTLTGRAPNLTYRPNVGYTGQDSFYFTADNGVGKSESVQVRINVRAGAPSIVTPLVARTANAGEAVTLTVVASSLTPVTYEWTKAGNVIVGATAATLTLPGVLTSQAGPYAVAVTNAAGTAASAPVAVTVNPAPVAGAYVGHLGSPDALGAFSVLVRPDRTASILVNLESGQVLAATTTVDVDGFFSVTARQLAGAPLAAGPTLSGRIAVSQLHATLTGVTAPLSAAITTAAAPTTGAYFATTAGLNPADVFLTVTDSQVHAVVVLGSTAEVGLGRIESDGTMTVNLNTGATLSGRINGATRQLTAAVTLANTRNDAVTGLPDSEPVVRRLSNISTRAQTGTADAALITGFVLQGSTPKSLLIRAAGPALTAFGVAGALGRPQIQLYQGDTVIAANAGWNSGTDSAAISQAAARLGAFAFAPNSADAALLRTLTPGAYTAIISGADGNSGITLVEVYDTSADAARLINLSTRGFVGQSDQALIVGIVVSGNLPKRLLIRAVGPTLAAFGAANAIADPRLEIRRDATVVATNDNWNNDARVSTAATAVGAFALANNSQDAALLIALAPGVYSVVVNGVNGATGLALVEVYEIP